MEAARGARISLSRPAAVGLLLERGLVAWLTAFLGVGGFALANGGYFPVSWSWGAVLFLWLAGLALVLRTERRPGGLAVAYLALIAGLTLWTFLSVAWTSSVTSTVLQSERALLYASAVLAVLLVARAAGQQALLVGSWAAITCVSLYGLATRIFPTRFGSFDPIAVYRLSDPVGYWNAFGLLAAMGLLLALGLAARGGPTLRPAAAASTVVLLPALYFTFSRGAWLAGLAGLAVLLTFDRRRLQLVTVALVIGPWPVLGVWLGSRSEALTHRFVSAASASRDGHGLAVFLIGLATLAALAAMALDAAEGRIRPRPGLRRAYAGTLLFLAAALLLVAFGRYGGPDTLARKAWGSFNTPPPQVVVTGADLNTRLFNLSSNGRVDQWRVAWHEYEAHPWFGSGAGTFQEYWFRDRPNRATVHNAHNLYAETLAELGPVGLVLLLAWLAVPVAAAVRARRSPLAAAALGAYVAYVLHAAVDWDWQMPALTLTAAFCGCALLGAGRQGSGSGGVPYLRLRGRLTATAVVLAVGVVAVLGLVGNSALSASSTAAEAGNWSSAVRDAGSATTWAPWSAEPWRKLGEAQVGAGNLLAARQSYLHALAKDSSDWSLWYELALASNGAARAQAIAEARRLNPRGRELTGLH